VLNVTLVLSAKFSFTLPNHCD